MYIVHIYIYICTSIYIYIFIEYKVQPCTLNDVPRTNTYRILRVWYRYLLVALLQVYLYIYTIILSLSVGLCVNCMLLV